MAIINCKDKRSGITYVYESESYWDKEKQQPRSHRRLIGKLDEATGEIVPTGKRGRRRNSNPSDVTSEIQMIKTEEYQERLKEKDETRKSLSRKSAAPRWSITQGWKPRAASPTAPHMSRTGLPC